MAASVDGNPTRRRLNILGNRVADLYGNLYGATVESVDVQLSGDALTCVLRGGLTKADRTLVEHGRLEGVRRLRDAFFQATAGDFRALVNDATGRAVEAYTPASDEQLRATTLVFMLAPGEGRHVDEERAAIRAWSEQARSQAQLLRELHVERRKQQEELALTSKRLRERLRSQYN